MVAKDSLEKLAVEIASLNEEELKLHIKAFHGRFRLDFTDEFLNRQDADRLRHILLAAVMTDLRDGN